MRLSVTEKRNKLERVVSEVVNGCWTYRNGLSEEA